MQLLLAGDHDLVRESLAAYLVAEELDNVATAANLPEVLALLAVRRFDLVLLDYEMSGMNGLAGL